MIVLELWSVSMFPKFNGVYSPAAYSIGNILHDRPDAIAKSLPEWIVMADRCARWLNWKRTENLTKMFCAWHPTKTYLLSVENFQLVWYISQSVWLCNILIIEI